MQWAKGMRSGAWAETKTLYNMYVERMHSSMDEMKLHKLMYFARCHRYGTARDKRVTEFGNLWTLCPEVAFFILWKIIPNIYINISKNSKIWKFLPNFPTTHYLFQKLERVK